MRKGLPPAAESQGLHRDGIGPERLWMTENDQARLVLFLKLHKFSFFPVFPNRRIHLSLRIGPCGKHHQSAGAM